MKNPKVIPAKSQITKTLTNRVLTLSINGNWVQKIDLPDGNLQLDIDKNRIYSD